MKINVDVTEAIFAIIGVLGSNSFYEKFDKKVYELQSRPQVPNDTYVKESCKIVRFIQSHWNRKNDKQLEEVFNKNEGLFGKFFEAKTKFETECDFEEMLPVVKEMVEVIGGKGIQNTKISKILHVLAPTLIPMIDPEQGKLILGLGNYKGKDRNNLLQVFASFHESFAIEKNKVNDISGQLEKFDFTLTPIRIFELLIWLQTQCNKKEKDCKKDFLLVGAKD